MFARYSQGILPPFKISRLLFHPPSWPTPKISVCTTKFPCCFLPLQILLMKKATLYHLIPLLSCVNAATWNFSIFCISISQWCGQGFVVPTVSHFSFMWYKSILYCPLPVLLCCCWGGNLNYIEFSARRPQKAPGQICQENVKFWASLNEDF